MASKSNNLHWEPPKFIFSTQNHANEWKTFYTCTVDFPKVLNISTKAEDPNKKGGKQLKVMFKGEDWKALQTLNDNGIITQECQKTSIQVLNAIQTTIKDEEAFLVL